MRVEVLRSVESLVAQGQLPAGLSLEEYCTRLNIAYGHPDEVAATLRADRILPYATDLILQFSPAMPTLDDGCLDAGSDRDVRGAAVGVADKASEADMTNAAPAAYIGEIEAWRRQREADLRAPDGWLSLTGLYLLADGTHTVGSDIASDVVLPASAPLRLGEITFQAGEALLTVTTAAAQMLPCSWTACHCAPPHWWTMPAAAAPRW